jgi:hypothetical protein
MPKKKPENLQFDRVATSSDFKVGQTAPSKPNLIQKAVATYKANNTPEARQARQQQQLARLQHEQQVAKIRSQVRQSNLQNRPTQRPQPSFQQRIGAQPTPRPSSRPSVRYFKKGKTYVKRVVRRPQFASMPVRQQPSQWEYKG